MGRFHQNKDFGPVGSVSGYVDAGKLTVYCPNAIDDDNIYFNSPNEYLPNTTDPWKYNHMGIIIGTGEWDNTRHESYQLSEILNSKAISIGLMTENGVATIGTTGATCCPTICQRFSRKLGFAKYRLAANRQAGSLSAESARMANLL